MRSASRSSSRRSSVMTRRGLEETIRDAVKRSDIVITTGGLGPTEDDVTRPVAARAIGRELVYHSDIEEHLRERFRGWGREMPEINKRQAYAIQGSEILPNPNGSACGMYVDLNGKISRSFPDRREKPADVYGPRLAKT